MADKSEIVNQQYVQRLSGVVVRLAYGGAMSGQQHLDSIHTQPAAFDVHRA